MEFNKSNTEFSSIIHRLIYLTALRITPLDISLKDANSEDSKLLHSCKQYHTFVMDMLSGMYDNPDLFGLKPGIYDAFLDGKKENAVKRKLLTKALTIRAETGNAVPSYFRLLHQFALLGTVDGDSLIISKENYCDINKSFSTDCDKNKPPSIDKFIPYPTRITALVQVGLHIKELSDESVIITNHKYPNMFLSMSLLAKVGWDKKPYGKHNFLYVDFRQIWNENHSPTYEDFMRVLPEEQKTTIDKVRENAKALGLRETCKTYWKVEYHYKSKHVMCIDSETDCIGERNPRCNNARIRVNGGNTDHYIDNISSKGSEFVRYFMKHLNYCTGCSTSHLGWQRKLFGRTVRLCCEPHFRIVNPSNIDMDNISEFIQLRKKEILFEKAQKA